MTPRARADLPQPARHGLHSPACGLRPSPLGPHAGDHAQPLLACAPRATRISEQCLRCRTVARPCWARAVGARRWPVHLGHAGRDVTLWGRDEALVTEMAGRRANPTYLPDVALPGPCGRSTQLESRAGRRALRDRGRAVARPARRRPRRGRAASAADAVMVSATKGLETDTLDRMSEVIAEETGGRHPVVVLSGPSFAVGGRARPADGAGGRVRRRGGRRARAGGVSRAVLPALRVRRCRGRRARRGAEEHHRDRRRRRRVAGTRPQRAGGADHARTGRDVAAGLRDGRPARDAGRAERPGRSRADVHRLVEPQPPRRRRARPRPLARRTILAGMRMVAEGVRTTTAALALGDRARRRAADRGADGRGAGRSAARRATPSAA